MLFPLAYIRNHVYNLKGTKHVIIKITNALKFDVPITYSNFETLTSIL